MRLFAGEILVDFTSSFCDDNSFFVAVDAALLVAFFFDVALNTGSAAAHFEDGEVMAIAASFAAVDFDDVVTAAALLFLFLAI